MVTNTPFKEVVAGLDALTEKLKRTTDEDERRRLLKEFRALLGKAEAKTSETPSPEVLGVLRLGGSLDYSQRPGQIGVDIAEHQ
jgi:hypothetical protein